MSKLPTQFANSRLSSWQALLQRFEASGLSVREFCAQEGVSTNTFYYRRARVQAASCTTSTSKVAPARFIDAGPLLASPVGGIEIRIDLGGGLVLSVVRR